MKLLSITFNNFKVYKGLQTIDCNVDDLDQPLVLVGGHNGAGKTSIIEAIKLCLYGESARQLQKGHRSYNKFLKDVHNHQARANGENSFSLSINLEIIESGLPSNLTIERSWKLTSDRYKETLLLSRDDKVMEFIDKEHWQEYIDNISPRGLSELLYFDSEEFRRVPQYLEDGFVPALMHFFGIDKYLRLGTDLRRYQINIESQENPELKDDIDSYEHEIELLELKIKDIDNQETDIKESILEIAINQENLKKELKVRNGKRADKRESIIAKKEDIVKKLEQVKIQYNEICSESLPFSLCENLTGELVKELDLQVQSQRLTNSIEFVEEIKTEFIGNLKDSFKKTEIDTINNIFNHTLPKKKNKKYLHDITEKMAENSISKILEYTDSAKGKLLQNRQRYNILDRKRNKLNRDLREIQPEGPDKVLYENLSKNEKDLNKLEVELSYFPGRKEKIKRNINNLLFKIDVTRKKYEKAEKLFPKIELAEKTRELIAQYSKFLSENRFEEFSERFMEIIKKLAIKDDLVCGIALKSDLNKLVFLDEDHQELSIKDFSAGESEIVALSILWAINKTSGKNHPIVTDSPLNRLDSEHRKNFIQYFIKETTNQIIFLSTDEEISSVNEYGISKYISKEFTISHDKKKKSSKFIAGYYK